MSEIGLQPAICLFLRPFRIVSETSLCLGLVLWIPDIYLPSIKRDRIDIPTGIDQQVNRFAKFVLSLVGRLRQVTSVEGRQWVAGLLNDLHDLDRPRSYHRRRNGTPLQREMQRWRGQRANAPTLTRFAQKMSSPSMKSSSTWLSTVRSAWTSILCSR